MVCMNIAQVARQLIGIVHFSLEVMRQLTMCVKASAVVVRLLAPVHVLGGIYVALEVPEVKKKIVVIILRK